jgi:hypothetical protein
MPEKLFKNNILKLKTLPTKMATDTKRLSSDYRLEQII